MPWRTHKQTKWPGVYISLTSTNSYEFPFAMSDAVRYHHFTSDEITCRLESHKDTCAGRDRFPSEAVRHGNEG